MTQQVINVGAAPDDGTGDFARTAYQKCNANFTELYAGSGGGLPSSTMSQFDTACSDGDFAFQLQPASHTTLTSTGALNLQSGASTTNISSTTGVTTIGNSQTTGLITVGNPTATGGINVGVSTVNQTVALASGATQSGSASGVNICRNGLAGSSAVVNIGNTIANCNIYLQGQCDLAGGAMYTSIGSTTAGTYVGSAQTTGVVEIGNTAGTGALTFGKSTVNQTVNVANGATASGSTKNVNIGIGGVAGSFTNITMGSSASGGAIIINGDTAINAGANNVSLSALTGAVFINSSATTGSTTIGGTSGTGTMTFGRSTDTHIVNIAASAIVSGKTKSVNIGTLGLSGSITNISMGSTASTTTVTVNGTLTAPILKTGVTTVAALPTGSTGARAFVSDANATTFYTVAAGGGSNFVPVFHDGANWRIG